jgi:integrase
MPAEALESCAGVSPRWARLIPLGPRLPYAARRTSKRAYKPVAAEAGIDGACPYDLRHAFASLLIHEGRLSVVEIACAARAQPDGVP